MPAPPQARTLSRTHTSYVDTSPTPCYVGTVLSENDQLKSAPPLGPSLLIAAVIAIAIPLFYFFFMDPMGFTIILFPIHMPLLFALIWPVVVAAQGPIPGPWLRRHTVAAVTFLIAAVLTWYLYKRETMNAPPHHSSCIYLKHETQAS